MLLVLRSLISPSIPPLATNLANLIKLLSFSIKMSLALKRLTSEILFQPSKK